MKISIQGYVRGQRSLFSDALYELSQKDDEVNHALYEKLEHALEQARCSTLTFYDLIMALLREDISKDEALDFLALDAEKLESHNHTNDLIIFSPKETIKQEQT